MGWGIDENDSTWHFSRDLDTIVKISFGGEVSFPHFGGTHETKMTLEIRFTANFRGVLPKSDFDQPRQIENVVLESITMQRTLKGETTHFKGSRFEFSRQHRD